MPGREDVRRVAELFGPVDGLTVEQVERFVTDVWPLIRELSDADLEALRTGILDGSLPPALIASGEPLYDRVQAAALSLWTKYRPDDSESLAAWVLVLLALCELVRGQDTPAPPTPPPATVVIVQIPDENRPAAPATEGLPKGPGKLQQ